MEIPEILTKLYFDAKMKDRQIGEIIGMTQSGVNKLRRGIRTNTSDRAGVAIRRLAREKLPELFL